MAGRVRDGKVRVRGVKRGVGKVRARVWGRGAGPAGLRKGVAIGIVIVGAGVILGIAGMFGRDALTAYRLETRGVQVVAEVVGIHEAEIGRSKRKAYFVRYRFAVDGRGYRSPGADDGEMVEVRPGAYAEARRSGEVVVRYWWFDPAVNGPVWGARVDSFAVNAVMAAGAGVMGVVFLGGVAGAGWREWRRGRVVGARGGV